MTGTQLLLTAALVLLFAGAVPAAGAPVSVSAVPGTPFATAAAVNTTAITVTWSTPSGTVTNYTLQYDRFYGVPIANVSVGTATVYNVTDLGSGLTYYFTVWAWDAADEGLPSNVAAGHTDPVPPVVPAFPWSTLDLVTTLSILGSMAVSFAIASFVAGRRGRRAEGAAAAALARTTPRTLPRQYVAVARRDRGRR